MQIFLDFSGESPLRSLCAGKGLEALVLRMPSFCSLMPQSGLHDVLAVNIVPGHSAEKGKAKKKQ